MSYDEYIVLLEEYEKKFGEKFPLMEVMGLSDDEIADIVSECLKTGKAYESAEGLIF